MRILVTGALGHIGARLIHDLRPGDFSEVVLLDNFASHRYCSLFNLPAGVPFRFVEADVCTADLAPIIESMDVVVHLAAVTDATSSFEMRAHVEAVNIKGTARVAEACADAGARLMFPSTTSVYGTQQDVVDEFCSLEELKPQSPYAESKIATERLLSDLGATAGLRFVSCRFGTVYGVSAGMRWHTAVNKFAWRACLGQPVTVWRTALHQRRPYLDVGDAVRAIRFLIERDQFDGHIYNVLTENLTVNDVVHELSLLIEDMQIEFVDSQIMNQLSYTVSNERFRGLGFEFRGNYKAAVREMVEVLRYARQAPLPQMGTDASRL